MLLHPGQAGLVLWDGQFEEFARRHRVVRYDARGYGRSERPDREYSFYEDLRAILDDLAITRAGLVGLSLGGRTILDFALAFPDRVACMALVNPGMSGYRFQHLDSFLAEARAASEREDLDGFIEVQLRMWFDGVSRSPSQVDARAREIARRAQLEQLKQNRARGNNPPFHELDAATRLREIHAPTLIVESALDQPDIHAICDLLANGIAGATRVVIDGAAHLVNIERPDAFADAVLPFLRDHPGR